MTTSCRIDLANGWTLCVQETPDESQIILLGPQGQGAAFGVKSPSVRDEVLRNYIEANARFAAQRDSKP